jgi:formylmethanofuran dehydrogenase subunit E
MTKEARKGRVIIPQSFVLVYDGVKYGTNLKRSANNTNRDFVHHAPPCSQPGGGGLMKIRKYTFEEFVNRVKAFHGYTAPGVILGGFMVDLAYCFLPEGELLDAISETPKCLPDAIQLLTPCTVGNGWLTVVNVGRFALTFYNKESGEGVRVFVDRDKLDPWPELKIWFFKLKTKKEQDSDLLSKEIKEAGSQICSVQKVKVADRFIQHRSRGSLAVCPKCNEGYPLNDGPLCLACSGKEVLYLSCKNLIYP